MYSPQSDFTESAVSIDIAAKTEGGGVRHRLSNIGDPTCLNPLPSGKASVSEIDLKRTFKEAQALEGVRCISFSPIPAHFLSLSLAQATRTSPSAATKSGTVTIGSRSTTSYMTRLFMEGHTVVDAFMTCACAQVWGGWATHA